LNELILVCRSLPNLFMLPFPDSNTELIGDDMTKFRPFTWVIIVTNIIFVWWIIAGVGATSENCGGLTGDDLSLCEGATAVGAGIGAFMIIVLWVLVDIILLVLWLVTRKKQRLCPACGASAKSGVTVCKKCNHDFKSVGSQA